MDHYHSRLAACSVGDDERMFTITGSLARRSFQGGHGGTHREYATTAYQYMEKHSDKELAGLVPKYYGSWTFRLVTAGGPPLERWVRMILVDYVKGQTMLDIIDRATRDEKIQYDLLPNDHDRLLVIKNVIEAELAVVGIQLYDPHPRNVIVKGDCSITLTDFNRASGRPTRTEELLLPPWSPISRYWDLEEFAEEGGGLQHNHSFLVNYREFKSFADLLERCYKEPGTDHAVPTTIIDYRQLSAYPRTLLPPQDGPRPESQHSPPPSMQWKEDEAMIVLPPLRNIPHFPGHYGIVGAAIQDAVTDNVIGDQEVSKVVETCWEFSEAVRKKVDQDWKANARALTIDGRALGDAIKMTAEGDDDAEPTLHSDINLLAGQSFYFRICTRATTNQ
ncbi:hypothetical protein B0T26DRAFT_776756 [Lasiosphaeria miniovina]|uniref:Protein kinase domain-containing protein n=1 Tax=Lasiosphaeria miniovina TaxID=1954250 RepID=A0AA40AL22_9PEZI|nr:uncharacterized protein B0T26DRAFT_776756 [Lasiosphaeria miniovina]KAK0717797.1 hypothetical protein B0T26DRAFT_776756 [Lasiosphaeria miniovina]